MFLKRLTEEIRLSCGCEYVSDLSSRVLLQFLLYTFIILLSIAILLQNLIMSEKEVAVVKKREVLLFDMKAYLKKNTLIWSLFMY